MEINARGGSALIESVGANPQGAPGRPAILARAGHHLPQPCHALHDRADAAVHRVPVLPNRCAQPDHAINDLRKLTAERSCEYAAEAMPDKRDTAASLARNSDHAGFEPLRLFAR